MLFLGSTLGQSTAILENNCAVSVFPVCVVRLLGSQTWNVSLALQSTCACNFSVPAGTPTNYFTPDPPIRGQPSTFGTGITKLPLVSLPAEGWLSWTVELTNELSVQLNISQESLQAMNISACTDRRLSFLTPPQANSNFAQPLPAPDAPQADPAAPVSFAQLPASLPTDEPEETSKVWLDLYGKTALTNGYRAVITEAMATALSISASLLTSTVVANPSSPRPANNYTLQVSFSTSVGTEAAHALQRDPGLQVAVKDAIRDHTSGSFLCQGIYFSWPTPVSAPTGAETNLAVIIVGTLAGVVAALIVVGFAVYMSKHLERHSGTPPSARDLEAELSPKNSQMDSQQSSTFSTTSATGLLPSSRPEHKHRSKSAQQKSSKKVKVPKSHNSSPKMPPPSATSSKVSSTQTTLTANSRGTRGPMEALKRALQPSPQRESSSSSEDLEDTTSDQGRNSSHDDLVLSSGSLEFTDHNRHLYPKPPRVLYDPEQGISALQSADESDFEHSLGSRKGAAKPSPLNSSLSSGSIQLSPRHRRFSTASLSRSLSSSAVVDRQPSPLPLGQLTASSWFLNASPPLSPLSTTKNSTTD